jgi:hypothetical protein
VYVYNAGLRSIPDDLGAPVVRDQFERAKGDVHAARRQGLYQSVEELSQGEARLGRSPDAPRAHHARFRIARGDEKLVSDLYLTVHRDHFVKIRCSRPDTEDAQRQAALAELLDALGTMLRASKTISWENVREQGSASALALSLDRWERDTRSP